MFTLSAHPGNASGLIPVSCSTSTRLEVFGLRNLHLLGRQENVDCMFNLDVEDDIGAKVRSHTCRRAFAGRQAMLHHITWPLSSQRSR